MRFTKNQQIEFLSMIREGMQRGAAADVLGLNRRQTRDYIAENRDFELAVLDAEVDATEHVREALYQAAVSGSVSAAKIWLEMHGGGSEVTVIPAGVPPSTKGRQNQAENPFDDVDNVTVMDPRRRRKTRE